MSELAAAQGGVVTAAQCRALGVDDVAVRRLLAAGLWIRARRGIYRDVAFVPQVPEPTCPEPTPAGESSPTGPITLSAPPCWPASRGPRSSRTSARCACSGCRSHPAASTHEPASRAERPAPTNDPLLGDVHVVDYDDADVLEVAGVPVLAGARLVLDCCDVLAPDSALAVADAALARRLTTPADLRAALRRRRTRLRPPI